MNEKLQAKIKEKKQKKKYVDNRAANNKSQYKTHQIETKGMAGEIKTSHGNTHANRSVITK